MISGDKSGRGMENRLATELIIRLGRLAGTALPFPEPVEMDSTGPICTQIITWLEDFGSCVFQSYVSQAVRIVGELQKIRSDLSGLILIVGSEPLTEAKKSIIESSGARVYPRYAATEIGTIAMGCGNPETVDELHLMSDMTAVIQAGGDSGKNAEPLYFTSLNEVMPRVLFNVQLGDMAAVFRRRCGCAFEQLGFDTHLSMIRSYHRFTLEGMAVSRNGLEQIVDEVLTARYGGSALDYQFVEMENDDGRTTLKLRISPEVGEVDKESLASDLLNELRKRGEGEKLMAEIWRQANAISVVREVPQPTPRGKLVPLLKE